MKKGMLLGLLGGAAVAVYAGAVRPWHLRWGATDEEVCMSFPGEDPESPRSSVSATHAITIEAPVAEVWSWLVQIGQDRGGFYSYSWVENLMGCQLRNADRIVPEWQSLKVGDSVRLHPQAPPLPVTYLEPGRALVLAGGWGFLLRELGPRATRLIARGWGGGIPDFRNPVLHFLYWRVLFEPTHFVMERKMLLGIKQRAEAAAAVRMLPTATDSAPPTVEASALR
ncbi:MAG: hypothetical protein ACO1SX_04430 [Actinomycetota bacterium]